MYLVCNIIPMKIKGSSSTAETINLLNAILDINSSLHGKNYLDVIAKNLWDVFGFEYILISYAIRPENDSVQTVTALANGQLIPNFFYDLHDTPCENVFSGKRVCIHESDVASEFPKDHMLKEMGVESYIGAPTIKNGELFGLVALLDSEPILDKLYYQSLVEFIASRISIELERYISHSHIEKLTIQANTDPLTGLLNRAGFLDAVNTLTLNSSNSAILFIDVDNFKTINDTYGHDKGDAVLGMLAKTISSTVRDGDIISRMGGEEFVILLPMADKDLALQISNRIHESLANNKKHTLTVSIGVSIGKENETLADMINRADNAMYIAKDNGKNQTEID